MYRHSTALNLMPKNHSLIFPSPVHEDQSASESDSETIAELDQKRRQLNEEVVQFKTQKEKEFRDFEQDLRRKRKRKRSPANGDVRSHSGRTSPTVLTLLGSGSGCRSQANGYSTAEVQLQASGTKPSKPTLAVEKLTITGTHGPLATAENPPSVLARSLKKSAHNQKAPVLSSAPRNEPERPATPIARDHNDPFAGVFTPSFLPLLDSRSSSANSIPQANAPILKSSSEPKPQTPPPGSESSSLPSSPISPRPLGPTKRSYTAPILPSTSLQSALRTASGDLSSKNKRKRVTFRLADSAVVEPSSSYEEMSSPIFPSTKAILRGKPALNAVLSSEDIPWSWSNGPTSPIFEKENSMNLGGDGEDDEEDEDDDDPITMRSINGHTHYSPNVPAPSPSADSGLPFDEAPDGGSGVGFFELEEELQSRSYSPAVSPRRSPRFGFFNDWEGELDDGAEMGRDKEIANPSGAETETTEEDIAEEMEIGDHEVNEDKDTSMDTAYTGLGITATPRRGNGEGSNGAFTSGSVPIDIVARPGGSWAGIMVAGSIPVQSSFAP